MMIEDLNLFLFLAGAFTVGIITIIAGLYFKKINLPTGLWYITVWLAGAGAICQLLGVFLELMGFRGEGLLWMVVGTATLSSSSLTGTYASKKQQERAIKLNPR
jgi:hypothetical protein